MTQDIAKKMQQIASQVDGLNDNGKVKAQTGNKRATPYFYQSAVAAEYGRITRLTTGQSST